MTACNKRDPMSRANYLHQSSPESQLEMNLGMSSLYQMGENAIPLERVGELLIFWGADEGMGVLFTKVDTAFL
jgi:hypothetical protein